MRREIITLAACLAVVQSIPIEKQSACGTCNPLSTDPDVINIHLVPHSHDDVGWRKTVDEYFYGAKNDLDLSTVQYILDSVVQELKRDPTKRFVQVETAFFWRWWNWQDTEIKDLFRTLVDEGRIELIGGGWSMHDEASPHYTSLTDNMALGFKVLKDAFGDCGVPRIAWQIDPFGHSKEHARLLAEMGFEALFFARHDFRDKEQRKQNKTLQFVWEGYEPSGEDGSIFTHIFDDHYNAPEGFCFDVLCPTVDPIMDDPNLKGYNLDYKLNLFTDKMNFKKQFYQDSKNIILTMGQDFTYSNANMYYKNMDKLIRYMNEKTAETKLHLLYSTPSCYLKAVNDKNLAWPSKTDDFFPYASGNHSYWTGYFTSRPSFKRHERVSNNLLQATKQINVAMNAGRKDEIFELQRALGVAQHHDAITGTARQLVDHDYNLRLSEGQGSSSIVAAEELLRNMNLNIEENTQYLCPLLNTTQCEILDRNGKVILVVYNPRSKSSDLWISLPIIGTLPLIVYDYNGDQVVSEVYDLRDEIKTLPGRNTSADAEMIFKAANVPGLGYSTFYLEKLLSSKNKITTVPSKLISVEEFQEELPIDVAFQYYVASTEVDQPSGAYIFRPDDKTPTPTSIVGPIEKIEGSLLTEWRVKLDIDWGSFSIRQYQGDDHYEVTYIAGPIPISDDDLRGKEVIMRYSTNIDSNGVFYTDSNGRQMIRRERNKRFSYDIPQEDFDLEPVSSNYYPVTTGIFLTSETTGEQVSVLTDRSQAASSLNDGQIELLVHRRLLLDDHFGVNEALNETAFGKGLVALGTHYVHLSSDGSDSAQWIRDTSADLYLSPVLLFAPTDLGSDEWLSSVSNRQFSFISQNLPDNVNLMTLEQWSQDGAQILLRLEHLYDFGEESILSQPVTVDISNLFTTLMPISLTETTLGANQELLSTSRLHWNTDKWNVGHDTRHPMTKSEQIDFNIELQPMQIRTFLVNVAPMK